MLKMPTLFRAAQLGSAPSVCVPSAADGPPSEVFHDVLQLTQGLGLTTNDFILSLGPEAEIEARQVGTVRRPLMFSLAGDRDNGNPCLKGFNDRENLEINSATKWYGIII